MNDLEILILIAVIVLLAVVYTVVIFRIMKKTRRDNTNEKK